MKLRDQNKWRVFFNDEHDEELRGKFGVIGQYADGDLDVWVTKTRLANKIERIGWKAEYHYDDGAVFIRPFKDLDQAARYLKIRKRRVVTEAMRESGRALAAKMRSLKADPPLGSTTAAQNPKTV